MASTDPDKRAKLIDELLGRKEFSEIWVNKWAEMLQVKSSNQVSYKAMFLYYNWLVEKLSKNTPMDEMVQELLGANGGTFKNPATNFYQDDQRDPAADRERRPGLHGHADPVRPVPQPPVRPLDPERLLRLRRLLLADRPQAGRGLPRDDRLQLGRRRGEPPRRRPGDEAQVPRRRGPRRRRQGPPRRPGRSGSPRPRTPGSPPRSPTGSGPTSSASGIVEPVDDFRVSNPASNPELLEELGKRFTESKYDLKALVRDICNSRTYQRSTQRNESNATDERNFAHANLRRIKAENLLDAISAVTDTKDKFQGLPARRPGRPDRRRRQLDLLPHHLRPGHPRDGLLVRGEDGADALAGPPPAQRRHRQRQDPAGRPDPQADRRPRSSPRSGSSSSTSAASPGSRRTSELEKLLPVFGEGANQEQALEDIFWALLNSREFLFNH